MIEVIDKEIKFSSTVSLTGGSSIYDVVRTFRPRDRDSYVVKITTKKGLVKWLQSRESWMFKDGFPGDKVNGWHDKYRASIKKIKDGIIVTLTRIKRKQHKVLKTINIPESNVILTMKMRISVKEHEDLANPNTEPELVFITEYAHIHRHYDRMTPSRARRNLTLKDGKLYESKGKLFEAINQDYFIGLINGGVE